MSRFIFTNNQNYREEFETQIKNCGFKVSHSDALQTKQHIGGLTCFKKYSLDNKNYYQEGDNWVATSGTFVYKETKGNAALKSFLEDAHIKNIKQLRSNCSGFYAVIYKIDNTVYSFIDETQLYKLYYSITDNQYIVTNESTHIYSLIKTKLNPIVAQLWLHVVAFNAENSLFENVKRLMSDEYIKIDLKNNKFNIEKTELNYYQYDFKSKEEALNIIYEKVKKYSEVRNKLFKDYTINLTGGQDSRLVLGTYINGGIKPNAIFAYGRRLSLSTILEDIKVFEKITSKLNLKHEIYDVSKDFLSDYFETKKCDYWKFGDVIQTSGNNKQYQNYIFNKVKTEFLDFGFFGEMYRQLNELELTYSSPFSLNDFVTKMFFTIPDQQKCFNDIAQIRNELYSIFLRNAKLHNMDINNLSKDDCFKLWSYRRTFVDPTYFALVNLSRYSYPVLGQKELYDLVNQVPNEWKKNSWFQLSLIEKLSSKLLDIPFFSHCAPCQYNANTKTLGACKNFKSFKAMESYKKYKSFLNKTAERQFSLNFIINEIKETLHLINMNSNYMVGEFFSFESFIYIHKLIQNKQPQITEKNFMGLKTKITTYSPHMKEKTLSFKNKTLFSFRIFSYISTSNFRKNKKVQIFWHNKYLFKFIRTYNLLYKKSVLIEK